MQYTTTQHDVRHAPFDLVTGAALMELSTSPRLWSVLRALTAPGGAIGVAANDAEPAADACRRAPGPVRLLYVLFLRGIILFKGSVSFG